MSRKNMRQIRMKPHPTSCEKECDSCGTQMIGIWSIHTESEDSTLLNDSVIIGHCVLKVVWRGPWLRTHVLQAVYMVCLQCVTIDKFFCKKMGVSYKLVGHVSWPICLCISSLLGLAFRMTIECAATSRYHNVFTWYLLLPTCMDPI